ncbi:hypothetical protein EVAR_101843_1 [Eumeta japonica]|uniref:Uncharacterized protein n=1 Tax=Eumeta variegata TaxID=151549 RepID=A0A4C1SND8_EUMVA|nr:hypothetical protein EVAR_101843_1 [Eumeta japonica]
MTSVITLIKNSSQTAPKNLTCDASFTPELDEPGPWGLVHAVSPVPKPATKDRRICGEKGTLKLALTPSLSHIARHIEWVNRREERTCGNNTKKTTVVNPSDPLAPPSLPRALAMLSPRTVTTPSPPAVHTPAFASAAQLPIAAGTAKK